MFSDREREVRKLTTRTRSRPDRVSYIPVINLLETGEGSISEGPIDPDKLLADFKRLEKSPRGSSSWLKRK